MNIVLLVACIGMITGFFYVLDISPMAFTDGIFRRLLASPKTLRNELGEFSKRKKPSVLRRELAEIQSILQLTGRSNRFGAVCAASLLLLAVGASLAVLLGNPFAVPVLAVGMMFLPFWYVRLMQIHYKRDIAAELETALSIITTAYLRSEDILTAVYENLCHINPPVMVAFTEFVTRVHFVDPDIEAALRELRRRIDNEVFCEWVDALASCQQDRGLKTTLTPIVGKLSDTRVVNGELDNMVFEPRKEFVTMAALVVGNLPLMYFLNRDWYNTVMHTAFGQALIAACAAAIFICAAFVIRLTQPIEYKR